MLRAGSCRVVVLLVLLNLPGLESARRLPAEGGLPDGCLGGCGACRAGAPAEGGVRLVDARVRPDQIDLVGH